MANNKAQDRTHWDGCHTHHLPCAAVRIAQLEAQVGDAERIIRIDTRLLDIATECVQLRGKHIAELQTAIVDFIAASVDCSSNEPASLDALASALDDEHKLKLQAPTQVVRFDFTPTTPLTDMELFELAEGQ